MRLRKLALILGALLLAAALSACGSLMGQTSGESGGKEMPREAKQRQVAPETGREEASGTAGGEKTIAEVPERTVLRLTVPKMERVKNARIPTGRGDDEALLRENVAIHLLYTGFPWEREANVYIAGHRLGYSGTDSYLAFYDIDKLEKGDEIILRDANGTTYTYKVFRVLVVDPTDLHVLNPIPGKNIVTLQACTLPDYSKRILVQGELQDVEQA
ncbi:peptidase C60, sortase A and B [Rubrobacter xylanophilus DSM 9941]|uniref:Peptidase C60, sortase A and B n=1 Tax=Rubrobacter xylanophilus (strain DSM 9941 / JCM 11954 / NBRC 16129 / PRD-1) TaxID=266117 RepID=Q1AS18_RUBXD|nr:class E sortase [Rubrobacter xylanophilus]ABG05810.1 peptidase C60, sortase A and B [Rubrobacter xylanophilus DSM 9941]